MNREPADYWEMLDDLREEAGLPTESELAAHRDRVRELEEHGLLDDEPQDDDEENPAAGTH